MNFKEIIKFLATNFKKIAQIILIVIMIFILLAASNYNITMKDGKYDENDKGNTPSAASNYTKSATVTSDGITTDKTSEELWNELSEEGGCIEKYLDSHEELERLMNAEIITQNPKIDTADPNALNGIIEFERNKTDGTSVKLKYMEKNAFDLYVESNAVVTGLGESILNYFTLDDSGNAVVAVINNETSQIKSDEELDLEYMKNDGIDILDLTEENKESDGTYLTSKTTVVSKTINYKNAVKQYTMPFQYLWSLLVIGENKDFVFELVDLVENSEITISLYDNITKSEYEYIYSYTKNKRIDKYAKLRVEDDYGATGYSTDRYWVSKETPEPDIHYYNERYKPTYETEDTEYNVYITKVYETNSFMYDLTKANVWIVDYSKEYEYKEPSSRIEGHLDDLEDTKYIFNENDSKDSIIDEELLNDDDALSFASSIKNYIERYVSNNTTSRSATNRVNSLNTTNTTNVNNTTNTTNVTNTTNTTNNNSNNNVVDVDVQVSYVRYKIYNNKVNRKKNTTITTTTQKYVSGNIVNNPKVDKTGTNFVSILSKSCYRGVRFELTSEINSWFMELIEKNPDTVNMVDLTKYLFYQVTGTDYGIKEYDFSMFSNIEFRDISTATSNDILFDYIASWESGAVWKYINGQSRYTNYISKYVTEDKKQYICFADLSNTRNFGYGVCHTSDSGSTYMHIDEYLDEGIDIASGEYDKIGVSKIDVDIVDNVKIKLINKFQKYVIDSLEEAGILSEFSQEQINSLTCITYQYGNIGNFVEMYKLYGNTLTLRENVVVNGYKSFLTGYKTEDGRRAEANWNLFYNSTYFAGTGEELSPKDYIGEATELLSNAKRIWQEVALSGKFPEYGGSYNIPCPGPTIDCSAYVSWVLYECGYTDEFYYQHNTLKFLETDWNKKYGWEEISIPAGYNPIGDLQPGDILVRNGNGIHHMNIVVSVDDGKLMVYDCGNNSNWLNSGGEPVNKSSFLTAYSPGKIIRVK